MKQRQTKECLECDNLFHDKCPREWLKNKNGKKCFYHKHKPKRIIKESLEVLDK